MFFFAEAAIHHSRDPKINLQLILLFLIVVNNTKRWGGERGINCVHECMNGFLEGVYDVRGLMWSGDMELCHLIVLLHGIKI